MRSLTFLLLLEALTVFPAGAVPTIDRVSIATDGTQADEDCSFAYAISANGRFVAFTNPAATFIPYDTFNDHDVFVRDLTLQTTICASLDSMAVKKKGDSGYRGVSISADGRYVAFESLATLTPENFLSSSNIYVRDTVSGTTRRVSLAPDGSPSNSYSFRPSISADGRYVAFETLASNLVAGDTNGVMDIVVRDTAAGITRRVSAAHDRSAGNASSSNPSMSANGRYVAFHSGASNLVLGDTNESADVFVRDMITQSTAIASLASDGSQGNSHSYLPSVSADGRYVAFRSSASNLVPDDTNGKIDIFVRDLVAGTTMRVSIADDESQANDESYLMEHSISGDGRFVAFSSLATNLLDFEFKAFEQASYVRDTVKGTTRMVSVDGKGQYWTGFNPRISTDGRYVTFLTRFALVPEDTNLRFDIYRYGPLFEVPPPEFKAIDIVLCLRYVAGLSVPSAEQTARFDVRAEGYSINLSDAATIARKVAGLEANP